MKQIYTLLSDCYKLDKYEKQIKNIKEEMKSLTDNLSLEDVRDLSYKSLKDLLDKTKSYMSYVKRESFEKLLENKLEEEIPEFKRAVYFPQINDLDIPDEDKKRIDRALNHCFKWTLTERIVTDLDKKDFELLHEAGILKKGYSFRIYGDYCCKIWEPELNRFFRYWKLTELEKQGKILYYPESAELDSLERNGYMSLYIINDEGLEKEFFSQKDFDVYPEKEEIYSVCVERHSENVSMLLNKLK